MSTIELKAYEVLKRYFQREEDAAIIIEYFDKTAENKIAHKKDVFLTKDYKIELIREIKETKVELFKEIKETKADMIKWMFLFWIGQIGIGIVMYFLHK